MSAFDLVLKVAPAATSLLTLIGISIAYLAWRTKLNLDRRSAATSYSLTKSRDYFDARNAIELKFNTAFRDQAVVPLDDLKLAIQHDKDIGRHVKFVLAHWEVMSSSILHGIIDEKMCFEIVGTTLVNTINVLRPWIDDVRKNPAHERRYDYLLIIHDQWKERLDKAKTHGVSSRFQQYMRDKRNGRPFKLSADYAEDQWSRWSLGDDTFVFKVKSWLGIKKG